MQLSLVGKYIVYCIFKICVYWLYLKLTTVILANSNFFKHRKQKKITANWEKILTEDSWTSNRSDDFDIKILKCLFL